MAEVANYGAGDLDRRVTIQQIALPVVVDASGQRVDTWVDLATVWARIAPLSGRELVAGQAIHAEVSTDILVRYRSDVRADMRVLYAVTSEIFAIHAVRDIEKKHVWLMLSCSEGMTAGGP